MRMKFINLLASWILCTLLPLAVSAQEAASSFWESDDYSGYFIHEIVGDEYSLIKNVQMDKEIILRSDRIEILKKANLAKGAHEVSTYLLFSDMNNVQPKGQDLVRSSKEKVNSIYGEAAVQHLQSDLIDMNIYNTVIYPNFYDGVDLEVSFDRAGEMVFKLLSREGTIEKPLELTVWDANAKPSSDGVISNGVNITSTSADMTFSKGKIDFVNRNKSESTFSFKLDINKTSL